MKLYDAKRNKLFNSITRIAVEQTLTSALIIFYQLGEDLRVEGKNYFDQN
jgi:hypothetical protein